jgi:hypothetical protein
MVAEAGYQYGADAFEVYEKTNGSFEKALEVKSSESRKNGKSI